MLTLILMCDLGNIHRDNLNMDVDMDVDLDMRMTHINRDIGMDVDIQKPIFMSVDEERKRHCVVDFSKLRYCTVCRTACGITRSATLHTETSIPYEITSALLVCLEVDDGR